MKFLIDQEVYAVTTRLLEGLGHDVIPVGQIGLAQADDEYLLTLAREQGRILVTRDRDFGSLVFVKGIGSGVLYLRLLPSTQNTVHLELERVLKACSEEQLMRSFVVIDVHGHRIRRLPVEGSAGCATQERLAS
jgi:predicted nuclease of predicted toxin-antitoxin system